MMEKRKDVICGGIKKYIDIWRDGCLDNETYVEKVEDCIIKWKDDVEE